MVTLTLLGSLLVAAAEDRVLSLVQWKAEFQKHDRALNEVYGVLKKELPEYKFALMQADQREWVGHREYFDATYLRVGLLDGAAQGKVIKVAKAGGMRE